jgi:hypothetical protein
LPGAEGVSPRPGAGRFGLGFFAQKRRPELGDAYEEDARVAGHEPGIFLLTPADATTTIFVDEDVDAAWDELGPYLMHDVPSYAAWNEGNTDAASGRSSRRRRRCEENVSHRTCWSREAINYVRAGAPLSLRRSSAGSRQRSLGAISALLPTGSWPSSTTTDGQHVLSPTRARMGDDGYGLLMAASRTACCSKPLAMLPTQVAMAGEDPLELRSRI